MLRTLFLTCILVTFTTGCGLKTPTGNPADYYEEYAHIDWTHIGDSVEGRPIYMTSFGDGEDVTLFFSCFHGNERSTPRFGYDFANMIHDDPSLVAAGKKVVIVPMLNPDGYAKGTRNNANDVDLNRNYPTGNWGQQLDKRRTIKFGETPASEPETRIVLKLLAEIQPDKIISVHQPLEMNNSDGPNGIPLAELLAEYNGYPVEPYVGFPTPGSFGTYAGKEREISMVTLELPRGLPDSPAYDEMWAKNKDGLVAVVNLDLEE